jgi:hypothetical protein
MAPKPAVTKGALPAPRYLAESTGPELVIFAVTKGMGCGKPAPDRTQGDFQVRPKFLWGASARNLFLPLFAYQPGGSNTNFKAE